jgi:hypothetical protein
MKPYANQFDKLLEKLPNLTQNKWINKLNVPVSFKEIEFRVKTHLRKLLVQEALFVKFNILLRKK